mmetsp:Transcript_29227/g.54721  ORF Transcript_29227/g.54721 Transcript_29227/m.54721 type:complete len:87 (-) Transcript_29227:53-313(-)
MLAASRGFVGCVRYLFEEAQANVGVLCDQGMTALDLARRGVRKDLVSYLESAVQQRKAVTAKCVSRDLMGLRMLHGIFCDAMHGSR